MKMLRPMFTPMADSAARGSWRSLLMLSVLLLGSALTLEAEKQREVIIPGKGQFNVEKLRNIDTDMDISQLSLAELRVVRNALAARQGHLFRSKDLRSLFSSTTWYEDLMMERFTKVDDSFQQHPITWTDSTDERTAYAEQADKYVPLQYTPAEHAFVKRLLERESELKKLNFKAGDGECVNVGNILNPWQIEDFPEDLRRALARNGFAIVEGDAIQLFHIYEQNNYNVFPSFVTTDLYLQLFHFYFDCILRDIEEEHFCGAVDTLCTQLNSAVEKLARAASNNEVRAAATWLQAYTAVAQALLTGQTPSTLPVHYADVIRDEVSKCVSAEAAPSPFLGYRDVLFPYTLFRPRGHYTRSELLQRYFRTLMWLQTAPFSTDDPDEMRRAVLLAYIVGSNPAIRKSYEAFTEPLTFLLGSPDNIGILQVYDEMRKEVLPIDQMLASPLAMGQLTRRIRQLAAQQTRILPTHAATERYKVNLMPQRYMPDAEVLQEMADTQSRPRSLRKTPKALDVMAAMGVSAAEKLLLGEQQEGQRWPQYPERLTRMKERMAQTDWTESVATRWLDALHELPGTTPQAPYFMKTAAWQKKSLNTALASYAELKHDAILYAKQPYGAECGGGGIPEPVLKGYVEPSIGFWRKAVELNKAYTDVLQRFGLITERAEAATEGMGSLAQFLLNVSGKELAGTPLSDRENDQIEVIGSTIENISLGLVSDKNSYLDSWDRVGGPDRNLACIADVYTANALNIPDAEKTVLYEAVGPAHQIYVVVELQGQLWLMRGGVFSYRELERPVSAPRLTDEEWQEWLKGHPSDGTPPWMRDLVLPIKNKPRENAVVFYSTGC